MKESGIKSEGIGDTIAKATSTIGIKPCNSCEERRKLLNQVVNYKKIGNRIKSISLIGKR